MHVSIRLAPPRLLIALISLTLTVCTLMAEPIGWMERYALAQDRQAVLEELIPGFLNNRNTDVENLNAALSDGKLETLQSIGHSLKGVGGGYGFDGLSEIGAEIESKAKSGDLNDIGDLIEKMRNYLERIEISYE